MSTPAPPLPFGLGAHGQRPDPRDAAFSLANYLASAPPNPAPLSVNFQGRQRPVRNQGPASACTGEAAVASCEDERARQAMPNLFSGSPWFTYAGTRIAEGTFPVDGGASLRDAYKQIATAGMCPDNLWPGGMDRLNLNPFQQGDPMADKARFSAAHHQGITYRAVDASFAGIKQSLAAGFCPAFCFSVFESFYNTQADGLVAIPDIHNEHLYGGHAVLAVAYDANEAVLCKNSWGDGWGKGGYFIIPRAWWDVGLAYAGWVSHFVKG